MTSEERISFHILENALDYVLSAVQYAKFRSPRSWKYSILHLVAGIELLLKARLQNEHWSLLFQNVDIASEDKLKSGGFISVDFNIACNRLKNIAGINIETSDLLYLDQLRDIVANGLLFTPRAVWGFSLALVGVNLCCNRQCSRLYNDTKLYGKGGTANGSFLKQRCSLFSDSKYS